MVAGGWDIVVFDFKHGLLEQKQKIEISGTIYTLYFMKKENKFISGSQGRQIEIWDYNEAKHLWYCEQLLEGAHEGDINRVIMNKNEDLIISCSADFRIKFWIKREKWKHYQTLIQHKDQVFSISLNESCTRLVSCGRDGQILISQQDSDKKWFVTQIIQGKYGYRICFIDDHSIIFQPSRGNNLDLYAFDERNNIFKISKHIPVENYNDCMCLLPITFNRKLQILIAKNGFTINVIQATKDEFIVKQSIRFEGEYIFGAMTDDGEFLITWNYYSKEFQVRTSNLSHPIPKADLKVQQQTQQELKNQGDDYINSQAEIEQLKKEIQIEEQEQKTNNQQQITCTDLMECQQNEVPEKENKDLIEEKTISAIILEISQIFHHLGVPISYDICQNLKYTYNNQKKQLDKQALEVAQVLSASKLTTRRFEIGNKKLQLYLSEFDQNTSTRSVIINFIEGLKNQIFIRKNYKLWQSEEYTNIKHKNGQVLLISFCTFLSQEGIKKIKDDINLLKRFSGKWGENLRVVYLSLNSAEAAQEFMEENIESQKYIQFYFPKNKKQNIKRKYGISEIPCYLLIDQIGIVRKSGCIKNIEKAVNKLLKQQVSFKKETITLYRDEVKKNQLEKTFVDILKQANPQRILRLKVKFKQTIQEKNIKIIEPKLSYSVLDLQEQQIKDVLAKLFDIIPESKWTILKTIQKTISIPYPGKECTVCKSDITNQPQQYYSPFKNEHVCILYAEYDDKDKIGNQRFKYTDTLVFINGPLSDLSVLHNINEEKIGLNFQLLDGENGNLKHNMICRGCGGGSEDLPLGPRYVALQPILYEINKNHIDYCQKCFQQLKNKYSKEAQQIVEKDSKYGMTIDSLRLPQFLKSEVNK